MLVGRPLPAAVSLRFPATWASLACPVCSGRTRNGPVGWAEHPRVPGILHFLASLEDFAAFFGPQGRLQQFRDQYLKLFFEDNLDALYSERRGGYLVRTDVLAQLETANPFTQRPFTGFVLPRTLLQDAPGRLAGQTPKPGGV
nr:hypothetical protein [Gammaproteobacteria bacterium]